MGCRRDALRILAAGALALAAWPAVSAPPAGGTRAVFNPGANANVLEIMVEPDGRLLVGGVFSQIGGQPRSKIARLEPDGTVVSGYDPSASTSGLDGFYSGVFLPDGGTVFGGRFSAVGGQPHAAVVRIGADGAVDPGFVGQVTGSTQTIEAVARQPDGNFLVGGLFTTVSGQPRRNVARLNADGTLDTTFSIGTGADNRVYAIGVLPDGKILIAGSFSSYNGQPQPRLARLNADGSLDTSFTTTPGSTLQSLIVQPDGSVLIAGTAMDFGGGVLRGGVARVLPDGSVDPVHVASVTGVVYAMALQADGKLVVGGDVTAVDGVPRTRAARLNTDGSLDASFADPAVNGRVLAVAVQPADGKVLLGGSFSQAGGYPRTRIARLKTDGTIDIDAFTVTPVAGANGAIAPATPQSVNEGETIGFTVTPDPGYQIDGVAGCDGTLDGLIYTTGPIVADCTVTASFASSSVTYTVTPAAGANGALTPGTAQTVPLGQTTSFTVVPDAAYYLDEIGGCQGSLAGAVYTTGPALADCSVTATFTTPATIVATAGTAQVTAVNTPFGAPLAVRITDAQDQPVAGVEVTFAVPASGTSAVLSAATAITDNNGEASIGAHANGLGGSYIVTANVDDLQAQFALANEAVDHGGLDLRVTVSTDPPPACGTSNSLDVVAGEQINYCFTVTNNTGVTLRYHTLSFAPIAAPYDPYSNNYFFYLREQPIPPGDSFQYNHLIGAGAVAQRPKFTWSAIADMPDYALDANASVPFVDISGIGTELPMGAYATYNLVDLPFPLYHYGRVFHADGIDRLCISNSGTLRPHRGSCPVVIPFHIPIFLGDNQPFGSVGPTGYDGVAPYWDLLGDNGTVYYATVGTAPNRRLIVQWQQKDHATRPNPEQGITFQASIDEATGAIAFVYQDLTFNSVQPALDYGGSATVGLNNFSRAIRQQYSVDSPALAEGQSLLWTPTDVAHHDTSEVRISVGSPRLVLSPEAIEAAAVAGGAAQSSLGIGNAGSQALDWSLQQAQPQAHFPPPGARHLQPPAAPADGIAPASAPLGTGDDRAAFAVPAYGMKHEGTFSHGQPLYPVSFDATNPTQFVIHTTGAYAYGDNYGGDFVGDDFSKLYVFDGRFDSDFSFSALDVATGAYTNIALPVPDAAFESPFPRWNGLAWDRSTGTLYASTGGGGAWCQVAPASELYVIDVATGAPTRVGAIDLGGGPVCVADIAVAPNGAMYGIDLHNDALLAIDKATGQAAIIGSLGIDLIYANSLDFDDSTGTLYLGAYQDHFPTLTGGLFTVDPVTGLATRIGAFPTLPDAGAFVSLKGMAIAQPGGDCVQPSEVPWLTTNLTEGETAPGDESIVELGLSAAELTPGRYQALLCLHSNDRTQPLRALPVGFTVTDGETVFANGFEEATR